MIDLDCKCKCQVCRYSSAIKLWRCPCNVLWHTCPIHKHCIKVPDRSTPDIKPIPASKRYKKTLPSSYLTSYEDMLDEDNFRANRKRKREATNGPKGTRWIHLGHSRWAVVPTSFLGPELLKRFRGGRSTSSSSEAASE